MEKHFGLEVHLAAEKGSLVNKFDVCVVLGHWALVSRGLRCVGKGEDFSSMETGVKGSELLPQGWTGEGAAGVYSLRYIDCSGGKYLLKVLPAEPTIILNLLKLEEAKTSDLTLSPSDIVTDSLQLKEDKLVAEVNNINQQLLDPVLPKKEEKKEDNKKAADDDGPKHEKQPRLSDPLFLGGGRGGRVDPGMPGLGMGPPMLGRSDLDPLGGMMGGGMIMDPTRGNFPSGPRFDPVGPGRDPLSSGRGPPRGGRGWGDAMRPPDFDNMYM